MQQMKSIRKLTGFLLLACIVQACHSATVASNAATSIPLMCYVCEDCAKITKQTPLEACDAEFFDKSSTAIDPNTEPPTTTTTEMTADSTTTTPIGTTLVATETTTTTTGRTEATPPPETANPTPEAVPTPPTVGPPITVPTPPNVGTVDDLLIATEASGNNSTESTVSYEGPKALPLLSANYTYHCYSVQKKVNGSEQVDRGCSRVTTMESVCGHLKALNNGTVLSKCVPCSNNSCNGSSALGVSVAALMFTLIAAVLSRQ